MPFIRTQLEQPSDHSLGSVSLSTKRLQIGLSTPTLLSHFLHFKLLQLQLFLPGIKQRTSESHLLQFIPIALSQSPLPKFISNHVFPKIFLFGQSGFELIQSYNIMNLSFPSCTAILLPSLFSDSQKVLHAFVPPYFTPKSLFILLCIRINPQFRNPVLTLRTFLYNFNLNHLFHVLLLHTT